MKNLKEFKALIERYETIQLQEIEEAFKIQYCDVKQSLTGFGYNYSCTLCNAVSIGCEECVYETDTGCIYFNDDSEKTYLSIENAETPEELLTAYRNRAKFMRELLKEKGVDNGTGS